jgi:hypothetical protein
LPSSLPDIALLNAHGREMLEKWNKPLCSWAERLLGRLNQRLFCFAQLENIFSREVANLIVGVEIAVPITVCLWNKLPLIKSVH